MTTKRFFIILIAVLCALTGFARATDNKTFERFFNLTPKEFYNQLNYYDQHNLIDSAMLCSNIQTTKYGKGDLTTTELEACCIAFKYLGYGYLFHYCNYQLAAENYLKAEQLADKYQFLVGPKIANDKAILAATQNDLQNNFSYNKDVMESFKKASYWAIDALKKNNDEIGRLSLETTLSNLLYLAIKYDNTNEVKKEVQAYRDAQKLYGTSCNVSEVLCKAIEYCNIGNYGKAFEVLQTPINRPDIYSVHDHNQGVVMVKIAQYAVLLKCDKRAEALNLLMQQEQSLRENKMTFELLEVLQLIRQHYEVDGNEAMANKYSLLYYTTKDEFINKSRLGKMDEAKLNIELEQTREQVREMANRQKIQTIVLWGVVIIALLALTILAVLYVNYRKTKLTNSLLYEKYIAVLNAADDSPAVAADKADDSTGQEGPTQSDRELMAKITAVMESSPEIYNEGFSRQRLAELVGINIKYLSRAINACSQSNFNGLLNEYRIKEACRRLMDTGTYGSYTIETIGKSVGFASRSNFTTVFKNIVGLTPATFQKTHRQKAPTTIPADE